MNNYESYSTTDFLEDEFFIRWIKYKSPEDENYWRDWIAKQPENLQSMKAAEEELKIIFSLKRIEPGSNEAEEVWSKISTTISHPETKVIPMNRRRRIEMVAAAAILLIIISAGSYFYFNRSMQKQIAQTQNDKLKEPKNDITPGGNKATLTLSNGARIILDTATNGSLTQQGSTMIIKLDNGQLAYQALNGTQTELLYNTVSTPNGGQYQLTLADGTKVWLNAASSLRFPASFTGDSRVVELTGEGYFEVAKNAKAPFHVMVKNHESGKDMDIQVVGTHFNVNAYADETIIKTTLLEGAVKINNGSNTQMLSPGEQAQVNKDDTIKVIEDIDVAGIVAWKNGYFQFNSLGIESIMRQLARWYDVDVVYQGKPSNETFSAVVGRDKNLSHVLKIMEEGGARFKIDGRKIIVLP